MQREYKTDAQKKSFYNSTAWKQLRLQALERDNNECQHCKAEGKKKEVILNVDHKYPIELYPKLALVLDNLQTLCIYHHNVKEGRIFKQKKNKWADGSILQLRQKILTPPTPIGVQKEGD